jgi:hypothetical protein
MAVWNAEMLSEQLDDGRVRLEFAIGTFNDERARNDRELRRVVLQTRTLVA